MNLLLLVLWQFWLAASGSAPSVQNGILDLRHWDFSSGTVRLDGQWEFQPGLTPAGDGSHLAGHMRVPGYYQAASSSAASIATYRLRILMPESVPAQLALRAIRPSSQSLRILIDGIQQGEIGTFGTSTLNARPTFTSKPAYLRIPPGSHELVMEAAFFHTNHKGIARPLELGAVERITLNETLLQSFNTFLAGSLFFLGLQFAVLWWNRRRNISTGLFSLVCSFSLVRHLVTTSTPLSDLLPWIDWEVHLRLEYLTFGTIVLWVYWFSLELFPGRFPRKLLHFLQISGAAYGFFSLIAPTHLLTETVWYYQILHLIVIPILLAGLAKGAWRGDRGATIYLAGFGLLATTVVNDILYAQQIIQTGLWAPAGMLCLVIALAIVTSRRAASMAQDIETSLEARTLTIASLWEERHPGFVGHQERVARLSAQLAKGLALIPDEVDRIRRGAAIHDAGLGILPAAQLLKPTSLSDEEIREFERHTRMKSLLTPCDRFGTDSAILQSHHEHWDGSGYPQGLAGEAIPLAARIVAIADIWDALIHDRPQRPALSLHDALEQMERERGRTLDPRLLDLFLEQGIWKITQENH